MYSDWKKHFRHPDFRGGQEDAANKMAEALDNGMKFVIAELPTGVGKSDIAMSIGLCAPNAYIATSQNMLINQYTDEFSYIYGEDLYSVKGRKHYLCKESESHVYDIDDDDAITCENGDDNGCSFWEDHEKEDCDRKCMYKTERDKTISSQVALLNLTYYALATQQERWFERSLTIVDEAHNLASQIMNLTEFRISEKQIDDLKLPQTILNFDVEDPKFKTSVSSKQFNLWVTALKDGLDQLVARADKIRKSNDEPPFIGKREEDKLRDLHNRIGWYHKSIVEGGVEWVIEKGKSKRGGKFVAAKPLDTAFFAHNLFFRQSDQIVLQSATIVNVKRYCAELGIELGKGQVKWVKKGSPFPVENRLVYKMNTANMSYKNKNEALPKIVDMVDEIISKRPDEKGIIHTGTYELQQLLKDHFDGNDRIVFPDSSDRDNAVKAHSKSDKPLVLVSPAVTEGFDGKDDVCRFQIICKLPYPSLGDRRTSILAKRDKGWYDYQTFKTLIQAVGRGVRGPEDWCSTYILDSRVGWFLDKVKKDNPNQPFFECLRSKEEGYKALEE